MPIMNINSSNPDGKGTFKITAIGQKEDTMTVFMEGKVEGYGFVTLTHEYKHINPGSCGERSGGTVTGSAEAILEEGGVVNTPHLGTFTRDGSKMKVFFTDYVTNGDHNFVHFEIDLIEKKSDVSFWSLK